MKAINSFIAVLLVGIAVMLGLGLQGPKYDYKVEAFSDGSINSGMSEAGAEGWDIITCRRARSGSGSSQEFSYECIMRRSAQ